MKNSMTRLVIILTVLLMAAALTAYATAGEPEDMPAEVSENAEMTEEVPENCGTENEVFGGEEAGETAEADEQPGGGVNETDAADETAHTEAEQEDESPADSGVTEENEAAETEELTEGEAAAEETQMIQIRLRPDGMSTIIAEAPRNTVFEVIERVGDWFFVPYRDVKGYVHVSQMNGYERAETEDSQNDMKVVIFTSQKSMVTEGETIHLTSILYGFEGYDIEYHWQYNRGNGWEDIPGANSADYYYTADECTLRYWWRLGVRYSDD